MIFNISASIFSILVFRYRVKEPFLWKQRIFSIQGSLVDIVLTFGFGHDILILKMTIFDDVDYIDIEPALVGIQA